MPRRWLPLFGSVALLLASWSTTASGSTSDPQVGTTATLPPGVTALPVRGAKPTWLTPALEAAVDAADGVPVQAPPDAPLPSEVGIRPGSWMISPAGCTMNFVFNNGGRLGIGTAGHCVNNGDEVQLITLAPGGANPVLVDIGTVVIDHGEDDDDIGNDFALVEIRPELYEWVFPTIAVIGGPCGVYAGSGPDAVFHYGHGVGIGTGGTPRAGVGLYYESDIVWWAGTITFGDSGSPVRGSDLSAVSNATHIVINTAHPGATAAGTSIGKILRLAGGWNLVNSTLCSGSSGSGDGSGSGGGNGGGRGNGNGNGKGRKDR